MKRRVRAAHDYESHRQNHQRRGYSRKFPGRRTPGGGFIVCDWRFGDRRVVAAITPFGLSREFETPYIRRIVAGECSVMFAREIKNSPLSKEVISNLLENLERVKRERRKVQAKAAARKGSARFFFASVTSV